MFNNNRSINQLASLCGSVGSLNGCRARDLAASVETCCSAALRCLCESSRRLYSPKCWELPGSLDIRSHCQKEDMNNVVSARNVVTATQHEALLDGCPELRPAGDALVIDPTNIHFRFISSPVYLHHHQPPPSPFRPVHLLFPLCSLLSSSNYQGQSLFGLSLLGFIKRPRHSPCSPPAGLADAAVDPDPGPRSPSSINISLVSCACSVHIQYSYIAHAISPLRDRSIPYLPPILTSFRGILPPARTTI